MSLSPGLTAQDILLSVTTIAFDIAVLEIFLPLTVGASLVIASPEVVSDVDALQELLFNSGVTVMQATPAILATASRSWVARQTGLENPLRR
jgi:non-ribosomal peptide synthetase component F